jgi:methyl-accepting chemotaxis protein
MTDSIEKIKEFETGATESNAPKATGKSGFGLRMTIAKKIPAVIVGSALVLAVAMGISDYLTASSEIKASVSDGLVAQQEARSDALTHYLGSIREDLGFTSSNPTVLSAMQDFTNGWNRFNGGQMETLQRLYIDENPHPTGSKENLDMAADGSYYSQLHGQYHPWFREFLRARGYYDIFLFDTNGNLVYSVYKELDYATNLNTGEWKSTDLGNSYRDALNGNEAFYDFQPYAPSADAPASFISRPIVSDAGTTLGVLVFQMPIDRLNAVMQVTAGMGETGETYIVGEDKLMRSDSRFSEDSTILSRTVDTAPVTAAFEGQSGVMTGEDYRGVDVVSAYGTIAFMGTEWVILAEKDLAEVMAPVAHMRNIMLMVAIAVLIGVTLFGLWIARGISKPVTAMTTAMRELAAGNREVDIPGQNRVDEIGDMAAAVQVFKENAIETDRLGKAQAAQQATTAARGKRVDEMCETFDKAVSAIVSAVSSAATEAEATATSMASTAEQTSQQSASAASASTQATSNVQTVASAAEELSSSIGEIARQVAESTTIAQDAVREAQRTNETVQGLSEAGQKIGDVVSMISDIASQTNLLALNATIEAARAGEAGKGFAVVASEVKSLANQTGKATDEIASQIGTLQTATDEAVQAIEGIGSIIEKMNGISTTVASAVEEQRAATGEISSSVQQAATGTQEVSTNIENVSQAAQETGAAAGEMRSASAELSTQADMLGKEVETFLSDVRAA